MQLFSPKFSKFFLVFLEMFGVMIALISLTSVNPPFLETSDDSDMLFLFLEKQQGKQILGASSSNEIQHCPDNKPIIGWINFSGKKQIRQFLPPDVSASACFATMQEGIDQGYELVN